MPFIKEAHTWGWEPYLSKSFLQFVKDDLVKGLSLEFLQPILIELIYKLKFWSGLIPIEQTIFQILYTQLPKILIEERSPILLALAENINFTYTIRPGVQSLLEESLPKLKKEDQESIKKVLGLNIELI